MMPLFYQKCAHTYNHARSRKRELDYVLLVILLFCKIVYKSPSLTATVVIFILAI